MRRLIIGCAVALVALGASATDDEWPTPYSAEEIRDAWVKGFWLEMRVETPGETTVSRTEVLEWSVDRVVLVERPLDKAHKVTAESESVSLTWEQVRSHAVFAKAVTERRRESRETPLGPLEGWLFTTVDEKSVSEFFFADGLPGPPAISTITVDGEQVFQAVQLARQGSSVGVQ